ncbi:MAG: hypothetical protein M3336_09390 [Chloroflexota bacterium]|nr:hypothetical protein [Chloroflexota bacterium]
MSGNAAGVGIRWTIGDVSDNGWEALRVAIAGARRIFGQSAAYAVCVNSVPVEEARARLGEHGAGVQLLPASRDDVPATIRARFDEGMAEGVAWKLAPLRVFPDRWEISLDNDCILWEVPDGMRRWLERADPHQCLLAEDARALYGRFAQLCGSEPRNAGIRGLPPFFPLEDALVGVLRRVPGRLDSELDEQGLQVAALSMLSEPEVVSIDDVSICSPFPPHRLELGRCGAHFCGLNARHFSWQLEGRYAEEWIDEHWRGHLPRLRERVGLVVGPAG